MMDFSSNTFEEDFGFSARKFQEGTIIRRLGEFFELSGGILAITMRAAPAHALATLIVVFEKHFPRLTTVFEAKCCQR